MPSGSVDAFFAVARRDKLVPAEELDALAADPTLPQSGLRELASALAGRVDSPPGLASLIEQARSGRRFEGESSGLAEAVEAALDGPPELFVPAEYGPEPTAELDLLSAATPAPRRAEPEGGGHVRLWVGLGLGLWLAAILMWLVYIYKPFSSTPPTGRAMRTR